MKIEWKSYRSIVRTRNSPQPDGICHQVELTPLSKRQPATFDVKVSIPTHNVSVEYLIAFGESLTSSCQKSWFLSGFFHSKSWRVG